MASTPITSLSPTSCFCGPATTYRASHPSAADVLLLVEVSETSLVYDRGIKLALYAKFEVPEVWIIDLSASAVEIYREPKDGAYALRERLTAGLFTAALVPGVTVEVTGLLA